jgi:hypothetical protein
VSSYAHAVALCACARDQGGDLPEWAAWHARLGVTAVYVYDDRSAPPLADAVAAAEAAGVLPAGLVVVAPLDPAAVAAHPSRRAQMAAYDACIADHREDAAWLAFIDVDEFVVATDEEDEASAHTLRHAPASLPSILAAYDGTAAALVVAWRVFGGGGHAVPPPGGVVAAYTACVPPSDPESNHIKTIARSALLLTVEPCLGPHHFAYAAGWFAVDGAGRRVDGPRSPHVPLAYAPLALNHYAVKSDADFAAKTARGSGMGNVKGANFKAAIDARATAVCGGAARVAVAVGFGKVFG